VAKWAGVQQCALLLYIPQRLRHQELLPGTDCPVSGSLNHNDSHPGQPLSFITAAAAAAAQLYLRAIAAAAGGDDDVVVSD